MAHSISLATYSVRVRPKGMPDDYELLGSVGGRTDFHGAMVQALKGLKQVHHKNDTEKSVLRVGRIDDATPSVWGLITSGDFGYSAVGVSVETFERSYVRKPGDAELLPFYFYFELPADRKIGFLIVQRFGALGVYPSLPI